MNVICTVGYPGCGKSVVVEVAEEVGIPTVIMGNRVRERAVAELGDELAEGEDSESKLIGEWATEQRKKHGNEIVSKWTVAYVFSSIEDGTVLIDGVRSPEEIEVFEESFENVYVIKIESDIENRFNRIKDRGRDGEEELDISGLRERDSREEEWGLDRTVEMADVTIQNNTKELSEFKQDIRDVLESYTETS